jgi:class 3 adenylate cyclase/tetratricopeptide (TPR) repeat protein
MAACSNCGAQNAEGARFCASCGTPLGASCSRCGATLPDGARFCSACGQPVAEPAAGGQERKLVTVLFADVTGSTALGEHLDPERLQDVMATYFSAMREEIEAEGGTVEKFIGDAVMAAFGVPASHEDDPARALRAARRMLHRLEEVNRRLRQTHGTTLQIRIGVNTGEVLAAVASAPGDPMVTGDAVNVAARLEQGAEPGHIVVSERTARAARGFRFQPMGPLDLTGKSEPVEALVLTGTSAEPERGVPGLRAPMVGRDQELALLETVYTRTASEVRPNLVTVYGDPGVGKSRLTAEFLGSLDGRSPAPFVLRGRCLPYGEGVTYWPLAEILKGYVGVLDSDSPQAALEKVRSVGLELIGPAVASDPGRAVAALAFTVGLEDPEHPFRTMEPRQVRMEVHAAWRSFFSALAERFPVVAVVEDIHWADPAMLDLLEDLTDRVQGPLLLVCPSRPELTGRRPGWGGGRRNVSSIGLEPLSLADSDRLVGFLLAVEDLPEPVHSRILERAEGNPFFLEEIVRHLIDEGRIVRSGDRWRAAGDIGDVVIPDTVQAVLAARIDLLAAPEKHALQSAAVVGRVFWPGPVRRLLNGESSALDATLGHLEERDLVLSRLSSSIAGEQEFIFKHILTRDVAYESLPRRERVPAHAAVARWLEETTGERWREYAELLAHHYETAYRSARESGDADGTALADLSGKAFRYLMAAAEDARSKLASDKAFRLAQSALSLASDDEGRTTALAVMGRASNDRYEGDLAWRYLREAADTAVRAALDPSLVAHLCARAVETPVRWPGSMRGRADEAEVRRYLDLGVASVPDGDSEARVRLLTAEAFWPWAFPDLNRPAAELDRAVAMGHEAAGIALRIDRPDLASGAWDAVQGILAVQGRVSEGKDVIDLRIDVADRVEDPLERGDIFAVAAWVRFDIGLYREAIPLATRGFEGPGQEMASVGLHCLAWRALCRFRLGDWTGFLAEVQTLRQMLGERDVDPPYFAARPFGAAALVLDAVGDAASAQWFLDVAEVLLARRVTRSEVMQALVGLVFARRGDRDGASRYHSMTDGRQRLPQPMVLEARCDVVAELGRWDEAPDLIEESRAASGVGGLLALPAYADRLEGRLARARERPEEAVAALDRAATMFERLGCRWEHALTLLDLAEVDSALGRADRARAGVEKAKPVFEDLSSLREIDRSRALLSLLD